MTIPDYEICDCGKRGPHSECNPAPSPLTDINGITHKPGCRPALRKAQIIAPVIGMRCLNCGGETEQRSDKMNSDAMKQLSTMMAEIEAVKIEVAGMNSANAERISRGEALAYQEDHFTGAADEIRAIIDKMRRIDTRPGVS